MEAKVDVRKLQLLNDRIIQTLEALNQVRASVHGIGHTNPYAGYGQPFAQSPMLQQGMQQPWAAGLGHSPTIGFASPYAPISPMGLSHSSVSQSYWPSSPWASIPRDPWQAYAPSPYAASPYAPISPSMGLSHSPFDDVERRYAEQRATDVFRVMQTFPFGAYV